MIACRIKAIKEMSGDGKDHNEEHGDGTRSFEGSDAVDGEGTFNNRHTCQRIQHLTGGAWRKDGTV